MYPVADCSCQVVMVVVQGIPVEEVSTDDMRPAAGVPAFRSLSRVMERAQSVNGQRSQMGMSLLMGILLPGFAAYCYLRYGNLPCDKPVGGWLYTYAMVGLILGVCQLYVNCVQLARAQRLAAAASLPDSPRRQAAAVDVFATDHSVACLTCCVTLPLGIFQFLWWIKGNFDVWGTYPRDNISSMEGPVGGAVYAQRTTLGNTRAPSCSALSEMRPCVPCARVCMLLVPAARLKGASETFSTARGSSTLRVTSSSGSLSSSSAPSAPSWPLP